MFLTLIWSSLRIYHRSFSANKCTHILLALTIPQRHLSRHHTQPKSRKMAFITAAWLKAAFVNVAKALHRLIAFSSPNLPHPPAVLSFLFPTGKIPSFFFFKSVAFPPMVILLTTTELVDASAIPSSNPDTLHHTYFVRRRRDVLYVEREMPSSTYSLSLCLLQGGEEMQMGLEDPGWWIRPSHYL